MKLLALVLATSLASAPAWARPGNAYTFGVIGDTFKQGSNDAELKQAINETDQADLAFVVASGIKASTESCSDKLYSQRKSLLNQSRWPIVVSLAASDWSECRNSLGKSTAIERLSHLRDVFFADSMSLGQRKIELTRLSSNATFRSYAENAHWEHGKILFATINLPANNNHFRPEAGRNSEFEDRLVANRAWLKRLFAMAQRRKLDGLVLFSDGAVGLPEGHMPLSGSKRDGYAEIRRQIKSLAQKFSGQVLLIDSNNDAATHDINWRDNLGHVSVTSNWAEIRVNVRTTPLFTLKDGAEQSAAQ